MAEAFEWVAARLERETELGRLEARGTVRLALKQAGLEARSVSAWQMQVVLRRVLPEELRRRGVADAGRLCEQLAAGLPAGEPDGEEERPATPESIFRRLGG